MSKIDIKAVAFDFHGTLIDWDEHAFIAAIAEVAVAQGIQAESSLVVKHFLVGEAELLNEGVPYRPLKNIWAPLWENICDEFGGSGDDLTASAHFTLLLTEAVAYEETQPVLDALKSHYALAVVSNGDDDFVLGNLTHNGLESYFDLVVTAESVGAFKPDPKVFRQVSERLNVDPPQILYVGDGPFSDVLGARQAGMRVAWLNRVGATLPSGISAPDLEIATLTELLPVLVHDAREVDVVER